MKRPKRTPFHDLRELPFLHVAVCAHVLSGCGREGREAPAALAAAPGVLFSSYDLGGGANEQAL